MKTALIFPRTRYPSGDPPLGVAYLAAMIREKTGTAPTVLDTTFISDPSAFLQRELAAGRFDLVGISAMVTTAREAAEAARLAKSVRPESLVIMGGPHPTTLPEEVLQKTSVDAVCVGEGEEVIVEVLEKGGIEGVDGLFRRDASGAMIGEARPPITGLDALPFPALDLLPMEQYFAHWFQLDAVKPDLRGTSVMATRGCPFRCAYCQPTLDRLFGRGVRKRSARNVVDELALRREKLGIGGFIFADDTFIADRKWVGEFCAELRERDLGLIWGCNVRADLVTRELLTDMHRSGLRKIYIGIEVFDDDHRREIFNKKLTRAQVEDTVNTARSLGIHTQGYFMLGAPGETRRDVKDTARYARGLPLDDATFNLTTPLPGTFLYDKHRELVTAPAEDMDYYRRWSFREERGLDEKWLHRGQVLAYAGFYGSPRRLFRIISGLLRPGELKRFLAKLRRVL